jgi:hypothetical protein
MLLTALVLSPLLTHCRILSRLWEDSVHSSEARLVEVLTSDEHETPAPDSAAFSSSSLPSLLDPAAAHATAPSA